MRIEKHTLTIPTSVAAGPACDVSTAGPKTVFIQGVFVATIQIQISPDGTNWYNEGAALTAPGFLTINDLGVSVRANVTAYTSGTPTGLVFAEYAAMGG